METKTVITVAALIIIIAFYVLWVLNDGGIGRGIESL